MHLIRFESYIRKGLIIVGAFGAYSLGANNIANVMGVFIPSFNLQELNLGLFTLSSAQQLFFLGGLAIAAGILTYSKKVMETVGNNIVELSSEAALVVVLAQALVLFIFSSSWLSNIFVRFGFPPIPMVPVSSSQVIIGSVIGIGLYKGARNINFGILGEISAGWIATPILSGLFTFISLFFVKNIFGIDVGKKAELLRETTIQPISVTTADPYLSNIMQYLILGLLVAGTVALLYYYFLERRKKLELQKSEEKFWKNIK